MCLILGGKASASWGAALDDIASEEPDGQRTHRSGGPKPAVFGRVHIPDHVHRHGITVGETVRHGEQGGDREVREYVCGTWKT